MPEELCRQMARVRDEVLPFYTPEVNGQVAARMMRRDLDLAAAALAEGDAVAQVRILQSLREWQA